MTVKQVPKKPELKKSKKKPKNEAAFKAESQSEKELREYTEHYNKIMKNWNHNTMQMYPPTPAEWQRNKEYYKRIRPNSKGGKLKHGGKAKKKYGVVGKPKLRKGGKA